MKSLLILVVGILVVGCSNIKKSEIDACENLCKPNGGVTHMWNLNGLTKPSCVCANGMSTVLYNTTVSKALR